MDLASNGKATNSTYTPSTTSSGTTYYQVIVSDTGTGCNNHSG
ncbi:hypothetical protein ACSIGC_10025 [Tenacibaculum sp. ZS6-P6]